MAIDTGIFSTKTNCKSRIILDYHVLSTLVEAWKVIGLKIVLTMGSFEGLHKGHFLYLEAAKELGDLLIVGVDSDEKIRKRKGANRPLIDQDERIESLCHIRHVDVVTVKQVDDPKWHLIEMVRPHVLQATKETYTEEQIVQLREYCGEVVARERMAETSTGARIRRLVLMGADEITKELLKELPQTVQTVFARVKERA